MKLGLITYHAPHLKTEQLLRALTLDPDLEIALYALPLIPRPARAVRFAPRPDMTGGAHPEALAGHYGLDYRRIGEVEVIDDPLDVCVIAGAGLLPASFVERYPVVNGHPGLQPAVRGLDAFKWAICDRMPLGISIHLIDEAVDAGRHLKSVCTPVFADDSLERLAARHYALEIALLARFAQFLDAPEDTLPDLAERPARMRMPAEVEAAMCAGFPDYLDRFAIQS